MQITRIECELGVTVNAGDFQSVKATVKACADIDRNEDAGEAYVNLASFVRKALVEGAQAAHPDEVKTLLIRDARNAQAIEGNKTAAAAAEKAKPGRKAAEKPAAKTETAKLADTTGMNIGGLDKEDELSGLGETATADAGDDLDDLLGDGAKEEPVTREAVQASLVALNKKGGKTAVLELMKKHGAANLSQLPESKYAAVAKEATDMAAKIG